MSDEGRANGSTYTSQFRNLFGDDNHADEDSSSAKNKGNGSYSVGSVEPSSLLSREPMPILEERARSQNNGSDITPSILLEQLAYVDNFMPSLEQDFANLDSWILQDSGGDPNSISMEANVSNGERSNDGGLGFDARLAAELSAFADESFIFPDEEKKIRENGDDKENNDNNNNNNGADGNNDRGLYDGPYDMGAGNNNNNSNDRDPGTGKRSAHFLTRRRNTFLTSQYDHSKSRFSSKTKRKEDGEDQPRGHSSLLNQDNADGNLVSSTGVDNSPLEDHGGFTNVDIISSGNGGTAGGANDDTRNPGLSHSSSVPSPLGSILASQALQPYSVSASPAGSVKQSDFSSAASHTSIMTTSMSNQSQSQGQNQNHNQNQNHPQIHVPNYSTIPTSTLVALLPKVSVPPGAYRTLIDNGFNEEQIQAISAIIAHHEQEKLKQHIGENMSIKSQSQSIGEQDAVNSAEFLLDILMRDSNSQVRDPGGIVDSLLLNEARSEFHNNDKSNELIEFKEEEKENGLDSMISLKSLKKARTIGEDPPLLSDVKRRNVSTGDLVPPPSTAVAQVHKSHKRRKLKEKELVNSVTELSELAISLQQKIHTLEMENKLLKNLFKSSGEQEGIEKAESIKKQIMDRISSANNE